MAMKQFGIANMDDDIAEWKAEAEARDAQAAAEAAEVTARESFGAANGYLYAYAHFARAMSRENAAQ